MIQPFEGSGAGAPAGCGAEPREANLSKFERFVGQNRHIFDPECTNMRSLTHSLYSYYLCSYRGLSSLQYCSNVSSMLAWSHHSLLQHQPSPAIGSDVIVHGTSHRELCRRLRWWRCADHSGTAARAANLFQLWRRRRGRRHRKVDGAQLRRIDDEATAVRWGPLFAQPIPRARPSFGPRAAKRRSKVLRVEICYYFSALRELSNAVSTVSKLPREG